MKHPLRSSDTTTELPSEAEVKRYLALHPDFFARNGAVLESLQLQHDCAPAASLIERQVQQLRGRSQKLELKLQELLQAAANNDRLAEALQEFALGLFKTKNALEAFSLTEMLLKERFLADEVFIRLQVELPKRLAKRNRHYFVENLSQQPAFAEFLGSGKVVCGHLPADQFDFFAPQIVGHEASYALMPLLCEQRLLGVMMIGSRDPERFQPSMGVDFLSHLSQLLAGRLAVLFK